MAYFIDLEQIFQKCIWTYKRCPIAANFMRKKNKVGGMILPDTKLYCKAIVIKTVWYWHRKRFIEDVSYFNIPLFIELGTELRGSLTRKKSVVWHKSYCIFLCIRCKFFAHIFEY